MERRQRRGEEEPSSRRSRDRDDDRGSRRGGSRFEYHARSAQDVVKRGEQSNSMFDQYIKDAVKTWKVNDGDNVVRLLPPTWDDPKHYGIDVWLHYNVGPDGQTYLCLHKMKGEDCPLCEEHAKARKEGDDAYAKDLAPGRRVLTYIIDRDHEKEGVQAWAMPASFDQSLCKVSVDKRSGEVFPIDSPTDGFDVMFDKQGSKLTTKYLGVQLARRESDLGNDAWLEYAVENPLPSILQYYSYEHILKAFGGGGSHKGRDEREAEPRRGSRDEDDRGGRSTRGREEPEERGSRGGRSSSREEPKLDWDAVHSMSADELDALVEDKGLKIDVNDAKDDEELADWICEDLDIVKVQATRRRIAAPDDDEDEGAAKLRRMREGRGR